MLPTPVGNFSQADLDDLRLRQEEIDGSIDYRAAVQLATVRFKAKPKALFTRIRNALAIAVGELVRCAYCEDSCADEVEHVWPKDFFPNRTFDPTNYVFACGICNPAKSNKFAILENGNWLDLRNHRKAHGYITPPAAQSKFIDPLSEQPMDFVWMDLITKTMMLTPLADEGSLNYQRAKYTIDTLRLNRGVIVKARENAYCGFLDRMLVYMQRKSEGAEKDELDKRLLELRRAPHQSVRFEILRQFNSTPLSPLDALRSPEIFE